VLDFPLQEVKQWYRCVRRHS